MRDDFSSLDSDYESEGSESIDTDFDVDEYLYDDEPSYKTASSNFLQMTKILITKVY